MWGMKGVHANRVVHRDSLTAIALVLVLGLAGCADSAKPEPAATVTPDTIMRLADTTRQSGDLEQAAALYQRAAQLEPQTPTPLLGLGGI